MSTKISLLVALFTLFIGQSIFAQRAKSEATTSLFFSIPAFDLSNEDPSQFKYLFAIGKTSFNKPKTIEAEEVCVASGSKNVLKDAKKIKVYKYSVEAEINDSFFIVENATGEIIYGEEFNSYQRTGSILNETTKFIYGSDKCYWHKEVLKEAWEKDKKDWKKQQHQKIKELFIKKAERSADSKLKLGYKTYTVNVYTGKGGKHDYSDLNEAQSQAISAYDKIYNDGKVTTAAIDQLMVPINTWLTALKSADVNNRKARINKKVAEGLYNNLITAYFQMRDFDEASKYLDIYSVSKYSQLIEAQKKGLEINTNLANDYVALNQLPTNANIKIEALGKDRVDELRDRYAIYTESEADEAAIASGKSIYEKNITTGQYGPTLVMMSIYDGDLSEFPLEVTKFDVKGLAFTGGYSFESLPPEIGNMTNLMQINLTGSNISSIPDEIGNLTNLKRLNLSRTNISTLPESIKNLKSLKMLNIKKTNISDAELAKITAWLPKSCKIKI